MTDTGFAFSNRSQYLKPSWRADCPEDSAEFFVGGDFCYIHNTECILLYIRKMEYDKCHIFLVQFKSNKKKTPQISGV
jgi:hypothetical protein